MISTIIPLYNAKDTIQRTIESVLTQTYNYPIEIIIVNDGSTDGCEKIVEEMISKNQTNRLIKLLNKDNGGVSSARNLGIKVANGEWIALLDSDDIWLPEKLEKQMAVLSRNLDIQFIGTNRNGEFYPFFKKSENNIYTLNAKEIITKWYPQTSTVVIKKEVILKAELYNENRTHAEDGDLWLRITQHCDLYVLNEDLVYTGDGKRSFGESGLSANMPKMYSGEILALNDARKRGQINIVEYIGFYLLFTLKYYKRIIIVKGSK